MNGSALVPGGTRTALVFYMITLGLAVVVRLAVPVLGGASTVVTMLTPAIAAVIMLTLISPEGGWRRGGSDLGLSSAGLKGWSLAVGGPVLIQVCALVTLVSLGFTTLISPEMSGSIAFIAVMLIADLCVGTAFALSEEVGWRGYMLPRMRGIALVPAMLAVGFLHGVWHLPLLLTTDFYHATGSPWIVAPLFLVTLTLAGVFYGFLSVWTGSVWPVAIAHSAVNISWGLSRDVSVTQSPTVLEYIGGESGLVMITGLLIADLILIRLMARSRHSRLVVEQF